MKTKTIIKWARRDVAKAHYFRRPDGTVMSLPERLAAALDDPSFGWRLAKAEVLAGGRLPYSLKNVNILRAQEYMSKRDANLPAHLEDYVLIDLLMHPTKRHDREVLNALLISKDITLAAISERMSLPVTVIEVYSDICFSVRDRSEDQAFLAKIVFPPDRADSASRDLSLLRSGYRHGAEEVLFQAGWLRDRSGGDSSHEAVERKLVEQALTDVRAGAMDSPAVKHVLKLLTIRAEKQDANGGSIPDHVMGLGALGIEHSINDTVKRIQAAEIQKRLNVPPCEGTTSRIAALVNGEVTK
jgi:hypothetical protein